MPMGNSGESAIARTTARTMPAAAAGRVLSTAAVPSWRDVAPSDRSAGVSSSWTRCSVRSSSARAIAPASATPMPSASNAVVSTRTGVSSAPRWLSSSTGTHQGCLRAFGRDRRELVPERACSRSWVREVEEVLGAEVEELVAMRFVERVLDPDEVALVGRAARWCGLRRCRCPAARARPRRCGTGTPGPEGRTSRSALPRPGRARTWRGRRRHRRIGGTDRRRPGSRRRRADGRRGAWSRRASASCRHPSRSRSRLRSRTGPAIRRGSASRNAMNDEHGRALDAREGRDVVAGHHRRARRRWTRRA